MPTPMSRYIGTIRFGSQAAAGSSTSTGRRRPNWWSTEVKLVSCGLPCSDSIRYIDSRLSAAPSAIIEANAVRVNFHLDCQHPGVRVESQRGREEARVNVWNDTGKDLLIRVPGWAPSHSLHVVVNGESVQPDISKRNRPRERPRHGTSAGNPFFCTSAGSNGRTMAGANGNRGYVDFLLAWGRNRRRRSLRRLPQAIPQAVRLISGQPVKLLGGSRVRVIMQKSSCANLTVR
jgi:hypothetical protein